MPVIKITRKMLMSDQVVPVDWYTVKVEKMEIGQAKKDGSTNYIYTLRFTDDQWKDCSINPIYINEKGVFGNSLLFTKAFTALAAQEAVKSGSAEDADFDVESPVGKVISARIMPNVYNNKETNQAVDFMLIEG